MALVVSAQSFGAIVWQTQVIAGDQDVNNSGTLVYAYTLGFLPPSYAGTSVEVSGVTFQQQSSDLSSSSATSATNGNMTWARTSNLSNKNNLFHNSGVNTGTTGFVPGVTGLTDPYKAMLFGGFSQAGTSADGVTVPSLQLLNLTVGHQYVVQLWFNDSRAGKNIETKVYRNGDASNAASGLRNGTGVEGGLGFVATGTFAADAESIKLVIEGAQYVGVNAIQLRDLGMIPETSSSILMLGGAFGLFLRRKR